MLLVDRRDVLGQLAQRILSVHCSHPVRVAIDGIDAAGKTTLADDLVSPIEAQGRPKQRADAVVENDDPRHPGVRFT